jgi:flagellar assembly protein FliH
MSDSVVKAGKIRLVMTPFAVSSRPAVAEPAPGTTAARAERAGPARTEDANSMLEAALAEASRVLQAAERESAEILRTAQTQGFESGRAEGRAKGEAETHESLLAAQRVLAESHHWRDEMLAQSEATLIELVGDVAEKLFGNGFVLSSKQMGVVVERAVQQARNIGPVRVRLHPDDAALLDTMWPSGLPLMPDDSLRRGGCIVEATQGMVDGRIEVQLERIKETLISEVAVPG